MKKLIAVVVAIVLIAAACGDDDDGGSVAGGGDWCDFAERVNTAGDDLDFETASPEELETTLNEFVGILDEARGRAPDEISNEVEVSAEAFDDLREALSGADFDIFDVDLSTLDSFNSPEVEAAGDTIEAYNERECGIPSEGGSVDSGDEPAEAPTEDLDVELPEDGTVRDALVEGFVSAGFTPDEAECLSQNITLEELSTTQNPEELLSVFSACGIGLDRLAEIG